jgi:alpha-glucosidase (family GH31 glycosyl hydrolase)
MRSGYSGTQRFGIIPWSGDVNRSWGGLKSQMEIALQMGMQGIAYMHSDLGGFAGDKDDTELYTRWLQYGVFQPVFRPHAQESVPSEPVFKDPTTKARVKKAIELRYALLPYNYTLAHKNTQKGSPLMRPLLFECSADTLAYGLSSSYLWGDAFLVTPVVDSAAKTVTVSFPTTSNWYDFYTGKQVQFSETTKNNATQCIAQQQIPVVIDYIPVFVRGGAFFPMIKGISSTSAYNKGKLEIHFYSDDEVTQSSGQLVEDDGLTPGAKTNTMHFEYKRLSKNKVMIEITSENASDRVGDLVLHQFDSKSVRKVKRNSKSIDFTNEQEPAQFRIKDVPLGSGINQLIFKLK